MDEQTARDMVSTVLLGIAPDADLDSVDPDGSLREQLDLDSLDFLAFVERLSERAGVEVREEDYPTVDTLDGAVTLLSRGSPVR
jgi:acyl carrier protein